MENHNEVDKYKNLTIETSDKQKSYLPIMALILGAAPFILMLLWRIPVIGIACAYLFFWTWWGIHFQCVGAILGIIVLCRRKKCLGMASIVCSIIAILSPFIWSGILYYLYKYTSVEILL